jgi:tetratricopeptide (TPR) repeat protein
MPARPYSPPNFSSPAFASGNVEQISALNRAAAQATARRDFDDAISKLQDARKLAICRNLGLAFGNAANVAVQSGDFKKALHYYQNALEVLKTGADRSAYDQILNDYQSMVKLQGAHK